MDADRRLRRLSDIVVAKAEDDLGAEYVAENRGRLGGVHEAWRQMRAKQRLGELDLKQGCFTDAITVYEPVTELSSNDDMEIRYHLLGLFSSCGHTERANHVFAQYIRTTRDTAPDSTGPAVFSMGSLAIFTQAHAALLCVPAFSSYVERSNFFQKAIPAETPPAFRPGDESEAQVLATELSPLVWLIPASAPG